MVPDAPPVTSAAAAAPMKGKKYSCSYFGASPERLNMPSMRFVMRKPLTMRATVVEVVVVVVGAKG